MIRIDIRKYPRGKTDEWSCAGLKARTLGSLARKLKRIGLEDQPFEVYRGDMKCMMGESLYVEAKYMLVESDREGLKKISYKEPPQSKTSEPEPKRLSLQNRIGTGQRLILKTPETTKDFGAKI